MRAQGGARGREADTVPTKRTGRAGGGCGGPERDSAEGWNGHARPRRGMTVCTMTTVGCAES